MRILEHTEQFRICTNNCGEQYLNPCNQLADNFIFGEDKIVSFQFPNGVQAQYTCVEQIRMKDNLEHTAIILSIRVCSSDPFETTIQKLVIPRYSLERLDVVVVVDNEFVGEATYEKEREEIL